MQIVQPAVKVYVRMNEPELAEAVRLHLDRALRASLQRFAQRVRNVRVTLQDVNGPRGGVDKYCRVEGKLFPSRRWVMQEECDANAFAAITLAVQRFKYSVRKGLERARVWSAKRETIRKRSISVEAEEKTEQRI